MLHYLIELFILLLIAYALGAVLGALLRKLFGADSAPSAYAAREQLAMATAPAAAPVQAASPVMMAPQVKETVTAETEVAEAAEPEMTTASDEVAPLAAMGKLDRPKGIAAARDGKADKLQRISGIGPKNEKILHGLGIFHFDQIAVWSREQVAWVDDHLKFNGRIAREEWIKQARLLADGKEAEFAKLYGTGGMKNTEGDKVSGSRTRRS